MRILLDVLSENKISIRWQLIEFLCLKSIAEVCLSYSVSCVCGGKIERNDASAPPLGQVQIFQADTRIGQFL